MTKRRLIFLSLFGGYQLLVFIFTIYVEKSDTGVLFDLFSKMYLFKYGAFIGVALISTEFIWSWLDSKNASREKEAMRHENNVLKAKVYDLTNGSASVK